MKVRHAELEDAGTDISSVEAMRAPLLLYRAASMFLAAVVQEM